MIHSTFRLVDVFWNMSFRSLLATLRWSYYLALLCLLSTTMVESQKTCDNYYDIFVVPNKYNPFFSQPVFVTPPIRVDKHEYLNLLAFGVYDRDLVIDNVNENRVSAFTVITNDTNFFVTQDLANNQFVFNFRGTLDYNINNAHRYVVEMTVYDGGKPQRFGKALVYVPLINCNVHPPSFTPVTLVVATTFEVNCQLGILNAWDIDGDSVSFELSPSNSPAVFKYIDVLRNGTVVLKSSLAVLEHLEFSSFIVKITDDGSSCAQPPVVTLQSEMVVNLTIIDVNRHSPRFVPDKNGINYCEVKYKAKENSFFQIEIVAQDDDIRFPNGQIMLRAPDLTDVSPQYSFNLTSRIQYGKQIVGVVSNLEQFDYENPKYGSNTLNLMFYAEDKGLPKRIGYCFMTIEIEDVNDNPPVFAQRTYNIYIHEQYKTRYFTYRFIAIDKDSGDFGIVKYYMDPTSSSLARELFVLSLDGTLTVRNASCLDQLKKEERLEFKIFASDGKFESERITVYIIKTSLKILPPFFADLPEPPELMNISEMTPRGTNLRSFKIVIQTDPTDQFLRCFLSPKPNPEWFKFNSNQSTELSKQETCNLVIEDPLNYRVASSMVIYMIAEVGSKKVVSTARELKMLTINLKEENINSPKFVSNTIEASVVEGDEDLNKIIAVVRAYDIDKTSPNNKISYSFDPNGYILTYSYFSIDPITGEIKLTSRIKNEKNIPLTVYARDGTNGYNSNKPNMNNIYVDVKVIDINDNSPVFNQYSYVFNITETSRPGTVIGRLEVIDQDTLSDFYYSISDSTFGIRSIYDQNKIKTYTNYRGSAEIYLNNYLDYDKKREYTLTVFVSDSQFFSSATVTINVINEYDKPPRFDKPVYDVYIKEEQTPDGVIVTLNAIGDPMLSNNFVFEAYSSPNLNADWFDLNRHNGELRLIRGLDRDLPNGMPVYDLSVSVSYAENPNLKSYAIVRIVLDDINDNAPYLVYGKNRPLIIDEAKDASGVEIFVVDVDSTATTPFQFVLIGYNDLFLLQKLECMNCVNMERYSLVNKMALSRVDQKYFIIPYQVTDVGGMSRNGTLQLIVGDIDNNPQQNGSKQIRIVRYQNNLGYNIFMGTLYVRDLDDWDLVGKQTSNCYQSTGSTFEIRQGLQIYGPTSFESFPRDNMNLQCVVNDPFQIEQPSTVLSKVDFSLEDVEYADTIDLVGIRLMGIQAEDLAKKINIGDTSPLEMLLARIVSILQLNGQSDVIRVVTIRNYINNGTKVIANQILNFDNSSFGADVYFFARQNGRLIASQFVYQLLYASMNQLVSSHYSNVVLLFDLCLSKSNDYCPLNSYCKQNFITSSRSLTVDANATAFVGMNTVLNAECYCNQEVSQPTCFNGGTVKSFNLNGYPQYYCVCPPGYDGPRCQFLSITFTYMPSSPSHSYALFQPIKLCDPSRIEFDFTTERTKGLLLFNGPINRESIYFLAVEIANSTLLVHVGSTLVSFLAVNVSDKAWHHVDILLSLNTVQVILDKCSSSIATISNYTDMKNDLNSMDEVRLSLGGIPPKISLNHFYYKMLNVFEYEGCIRNLKVNGELRNLKLVPNDYNLAQNAQQCDCMYLAKCDSNAAPVVRTNEFPWWIILIILGALLILATILGLAVCAVRRKDGQKKMLQMFPDDDIRETIINYADGAGEENTDNFNIGVIKKPLGPIMQTTTTTSMTPGGMMIQEGHVSNIDLPSNDQNMIYAYEGEGSEVGSLSSLQSSNYADKDLDYDFLRECGPKFVKLSNIYVKNDIGDQPGNVVHIHHHHQHQQPDFHHQNFAYDYTDDQMRVMMNNQQRIG